MIDDAVSRNLMNMIRENEKLKIQVTNLQNALACLALSAAVGIMLLKSKYENKKTGE